MNTEHLMVLVGREYLVDAKISESGYLVSRVKHKEKWSKWTRPYVPTRRKDQNKLDNFQEFLTSIGGELIGKGGTP